MNIIRLFHILYILIIYDIILPKTSLSVSCIMLSPIILPVRIFNRIRYKSRKNERLIKGFYKAGPTFIKLGQFLATRPDLVGEEYASTLEELQDRLPYSDTISSIAMLEKEFGKKINLIFKEFIEKPVSAASIAVVHKAITFDNRVVAVKIIRPNVKKIFKKDISLLYSFAKILNLFPSLKRLKFIEVVDELNETIRKELDLRLEAASASLFKENMKNDHDFYIPEVFWQYTTSTVLTTEFINGIPINSNLPTNIDKNLLAEKVVTLYFKQVYRDGFFHADMHQGNLFVLNDERVGVIDFGIMGRLSKRNKIFVAEILHGFLKRNYRRVAEVHHLAGFIPSSVDIDDFSLACRAIGESVVGLPSNKISMANLLGQLFKVTGDYGMETQPELLLLQKTMLMMEGVAIKLNNNLNIWQTIEPLMERWAIDNISFEAKVRDSFIGLFKRITGNDGFA